VAPGSARATYLAVTDIEAAHQELSERGVTVSGIRRKAPVDGWKGGWRPGTDPERRDYASLADFADPWQYLVDPGDRLSPAMRRWRRRARLTNPD
jgi:hypothetical protein